LYKIELAGLEVDAPAVEHIPVLAETLAEQINLPPDGVMVDATIGHAKSFCFIRIFRKSANKSISRG